MEAVLRKKLKETAPIVLARYNTTAYNGNSVIQKLAEILTELENATSPGMVEEFKHQNANTKKGTISGQIREVDIDKEWITSRHQGIGKQVTSDPLETGLTRNTARPWWRDLDTAKKLESCLKKLDAGVSRKRRNWATEQRLELNKLELMNQLGRTWERLLLEYFVDKMRAPSSAKHL